VIALWIEAESVSSLRYSLIGCCCVCFVWNCVGRIACSHAAYGSTYPYVDEL
jgi:hypothetical protein